MLDLTTWLQQLGLSKFVKTFEENEVDLEALPHLTDNMLAQMGLPIGPRAKLLAAISKLASIDPVPEARLPDGTRGEPTLPSRHAERRQITVMFCDLVDSTKLAGSLEPEDFQALMEKYQKACGDVIKRHGGHISQFRGDGLEVYFGWPVAQEDTAERAVRAGLDVVQAVGGLSISDPVSVRVGINTGVVVVTESASGDPSIPSGAVGEALHIAARLQSAALPNSVVIGEATNRLVLEHFVQEDLGPQTLKGVSAPIRAFRVLRTREPLLRFRATAGKSLTPLVGRHAELEFLKQCWSDARDGEGQAVFISGVPGIGKSRIVHELHAQIQKDTHFTLNFQCSQFYVNSALYPVTQLIQRLSGLKPDDSANTKLDKIERLVGLASTRAADLAPFVAEIMSIPTAARYKPIAPGAAQRKAQSLSVLIELLGNLAAKRPVFCVFEDVHWIDPSTQELLDLIVTDINKWRILLIATHRPEYQFRSHGNARGLTMNRLKRRDAAEMARLAIGDREISNDAMTRIVDESDLIPLFLEELARGTVDSPSTRSPLVHDPASESVIPESLRDALAVRLDRAPKARNVAQMAAVIGREFSYDLLSRLTSLADVDLEVALTHLRDSDIIQVLESRPVVRYSFKHSLVRDIAYDSLLKSSRREMHLKIATILTQETTGPEAAPPELIAYHYMLAGNAELAVKYWLLGGRRARTQSAHLEASVQYQKALELLRLLPDTVERRATELDAQLSLGGCFIAMFGYSSNETRDAFESSYKLSSELGDWRKEFQANFGLWGHYWMRAQHPRAQELAETLLGKADQFRDLTGLTVGWRALGSTLFTFGDFIRARSHLERAVELGGRSGREELSLTFAVNPSIAAQLMLAWTLWILGYPDQARRDVMQALSRATELGDAYTAAFAHYVTSVVQLLCGEFERSLASADRSLALSREHRINLYALYSQFGRGCAHARMGKIELGMFEIKEGIEEAGRSKLGYMRGFMLGWLASVQAESGQPERALSTLDEALEQTNDVTGRAWEAELLRLRGDVLLAMHSDAFTEAEQCYERAISVARKQSARALELRAVTSLARLVDAQGKRNEARAKLSAAYEWFTEGFDTADLKAARQLLDELEERP